MSHRLLTYNIHSGGSGREAELAKIIDACQPDIVMLQEAVRPDVVEQLASVCKMEYFGSRQGESLAFISRLPIQSYSWHQPRFTRRPYLQVLLADSGVHVFGVHLAAIDSNLSYRRRTQELVQLLHRIKGQNLGLHLITGDFNAPEPGIVPGSKILPPSRAAVWLGVDSQRWTTFQLLLANGYVEACQGPQHDSTINNFPTWYPHLRLDYTFVPAEFASRILSCTVMQDIPDASQASDHFPLLTVFQDEETRITPPGDVVNHAS